MSEQILDCFGVPEHYVTHIGAVESAENGNVRVIRCIKRGGVLVPVYSVVSPLMNMSICASELRQAMQNIFDRDQMVGVLALH